MANFVIMYHTILRFLNELDKNNQSSITKTAILKGVFYWGTGTSFRGAIRLGFPAPTLSSSCLMLRLYQARGIDEVLRKLIPDSSNKLPSAAQATEGCFFEVDSKKEK